MKLFSIDTGYFKLDGGAMFGVVPKTIWNTLNPSDENNRCTWAMRCLLVDDGERVVLIDTGIGNKQDQRFFGYYHLHGNQSLSASLLNCGYSNEDITDVFLTHLHFDHCGGVISKKEEGVLIPAFPNAKVWCSEKQWQNASTPNPREKASYLSDNILPIRDLCDLILLKDGISPFSWMELKECDGHTLGQLIPIIHTPTASIVYAADLIPSQWHVGLPYVMAYDTQPLLSMVEKEEVLTRAEKNGYILFLEHDPSTECVSLTRTEKGIKVLNSMPLSDIFPIL